MEALSEDASRPACGRGRPRPTGSTFWTAFASRRPDRCSATSCRGCSPACRRCSVWVAPMQPAAPAVPVGPDAVADTLAEAMAVVVGATTPGAVNHDGDADVFVVELEAGRLYQVDVELITLDDSVATLYGRAGEWLAENDDHAGTGASRFYWRAAHDRAPLRRSHQLGRRGHGGVRADDRAARHRGRPRRYGRGGHAGDAGRGHAGRAAVQRRRGLLRDRVGGRTGSTRST